MSCVREKRFARQPTQEGALVRTTAADELLDHLRRVGVVLWPVKISGGALSARVILPTREAVRAALALGLDSRAERVSPMRIDQIGTGIPVAALCARLTRRQATILQRAVEVGFYDVPRQTTGTELARELGLAHATVLEHIRKAERALLADLARVVLSGAHERAWKRAGRPRKNAASA